MSLLNNKISTSPEKPEKTTIREMLNEYFSTRNPDLKNRIVLAHMNLVRFLAARFLNRGESIEDLIQTGYFGLIKAVERYDPEKGVEFNTYAVPTIIGEIKRYLRDREWVLKVPRKLQELNISVNKTIDDLTASLNRSPTISEVAKILGVTEEEVIEAQELGHSHRPLSLNTEFEMEEDSRFANLIGFLGRKDENLEMLEDRIALEKAISSLSKREQLILQLKYFEGITQTKIAKKMNTSQMHISRLERRALNKLRAILKQD